MAENPLTTFARNNIVELILGLAIGVIIVLLMDFNLQESMAIIVLGPLVALVINQLLKVVVPNTKNERTALVILAVVGGFFLLLQFNLGVFSLDNVNSQSFVEVELQPQITGAALVGIGSVLGGVSKLPFLIIAFVAIIALVMFFPIIGIPLLILLLIFLSSFVFKIFQNFTLILILTAGYFILKLIFGAQVKKQASKL